MNRRPHRARTSAAVVVLTPTALIRRDLLLLAIPTVWLLIFLAGCSPTTDSQAPAGSPPEADARVESDPSRSADVLSPLNREGYDRFLTEHRGRVVLVDFWATWCTSCLEGFPKTVQLDERYRDQGLTVASVAINDPEDEPQIVEFLQSQSAAFSHFRADYRGAANAMDAFEISSGTLPTVKVYDRAGTLRYTFGNGEPFDHQEVEVVIRQLLAEAA